MVKWFENRQPWRWRAWARLSDGENDRTRWGNGGGLLGLSRCTKKSKRGGLWRRNREEGAELCLELRHGEMHASRCMD